MDSELDGSSKLLERWFAGDADARDRLVGRYLGWIHERVSRRLGDLLRRVGDTGDFVQDAVLQLLNYIPQQHIKNERHFRGVLARIVENVIRDKFDWATAERRSVRREQPLAVPLAGSVSEAPSAEAYRGEDAATVNLALHLLPDLDRRAVILRDWEGLEFKEVGELLDTSPDAARMRYRRALAKLTVNLVAIRNGRLDTLLDPDDP